MADDGILVNFSLNDEIVRSKPVFKGGRWRDRLSAKRSTRPRTPKPASTDGNANTTTILPKIRPETGEVEDTEAPPPKRRKFESRPKPTASGNNAAKEVISSLFTYNPSAQAPAEKPQEDEQPAEPSNAPLPDGIETFTSLGLSTTLSAHLLTKLALKSPTAIQASTIKQLLSEDADAFIQAETGSGKTLAYLLPVVQRIMSEARRREKESTKTEGGNSRRPQIRSLHDIEDGNPNGAAEGSAQKKQNPNRKAGLFAIVLAPTRELASQISLVLNSLLTRAPYIVASTVIGGEKRKSEKARLRKGANILVATPGRLADHLENTEVLDVSQVRWLVLDEGDRLMELGFEEEIKGIVEKLERKRKFGRENVIGTEKSGPGGEKGTEELPSRRVTVLCSATMKMTVQRLGEISLKDAVHIKAEAQFQSKTLATTNGEPKENGGNGGKAFQAPAQLKQSFIIVPPKQRLVTLAALLKHTFARRGSVMKAIVFLSCADSVDFHFDVFAHKVSEESTEEAPKGTATSTATAITVSPSPSLTSKANPSLNIHRLHGSLPQPIRTSTLKSFSHSTNPAILLCTDVVSRGLDLPNIDLVIEYDPPFSADDHLHRVGRTARAGKAGRAECFLMPGAEEGYVEVLKEGVAGGKVNRHEAEEILRKGFAVEKTVKGANTEGPKNWEEAATEYQLKIERWVIEDARAGEMARKAYVSHVRAYATHVAKERSMFDVKALHLGHLAKAFALRERPGNFGRGAVAGGGGTKPAKRQFRQGEKRKAGEGGSDKATAVLAEVANGNANPSWRKADIDAEAVDGKDAARRMRAKMKEHMAAASEFNIG